MKLLITYQKKKTIDIVSNVEGSVIPYQGYIDAPIDDINNYPEYSLLKDVNELGVNSDDIIANNKIYFYDCYYYDNTKGDFDSFDVLSVYNGGSKYIINPIDDKYRDYSDYARQYRPYDFFVIPENDGKIISHLQLNLRFAAFFIYLYGVIKTSITGKSYIKIDLSATTKFPNLQINSISNIKPDGYGIVYDSTKNQVSYFINPEENCLYILLEDDYVSDYNNLIAMIESSSKKSTYSDHQYFSITIDYYIPNTTITTFEYWPD